MFACGGQLTPSSSWLYGAGRREAAGEGMCCRHVALIPELLPQDLARRTGLPERGRHAGRLHPRQHAAGRLVRRTAAIPSQ